MNIFLAHSPNRSRQLFHLYDKPSFIYLRWAPASYERHSPVVVRSGVGHFNLRTMNRYVQSTKCDPGAIASLYAREAFFVDDISENVRSLLVFADPSD